MFFQRFIIAILVRIVLSQNSTTNNTKFNSRKNLYTKLLTDYQDDLKPPELTTVVMGLNLLKIVSLLEKEQVIVLEIMFTQIWFDSRLRWASADYGNLKEMYLASDKIWVPDTLIVTSGDSDRFIKSDSYTQASITYNGQVKFTKVFNQVKSKCKMNIKNFPFDEQSCQIVLQSASYTSEDLKFVKGLSDNLPFDDNQIWLLKKFDYIVNDSLVISSAYNYSNVLINVVIRRKPLYIIVNLMIPTLFLSTVTLIAFFAPYAQAMPITMSVLLAYSVLTLKVNDTLPQSDIVPLLSIYFIVCMGYSLLGIAWFTCMNKMREKKRLLKIIQYFSCCVSAIFYDAPKFIFRTFKKVNKVKDIAENDANSNGEGNNFDKLLNRINIFVFFCFLLSGILFQVLFLIVFSNN